MAKSRVERLLVIGLDCASPRFVFDREGLPLPNLHGMMARGVWGTLKSCDPPITVPAWSCMTTGRDPGELGVYGFRNRVDHSYSRMVLNTGTSIREKRIWDYTSEAGLDNVILGVPQTYPPQPLRGCLVSGLLTPTTDSAYTYPDALAEELDAHTGGYLIDVEGFRTEDRGPLLDRIHRVMHNRFDVAEYLLTSRPWQFAMVVDIALDRLHHAFWQYCDPAHPRYVAGHPFADAIPAYYRALDERVGRLREIVGDSAAIVVASDHGARAMQGGFAVNQWLVEEGYLALKRVPGKVEPFSVENVDWSATRAWGEGGYYGRIHVNLAGREPQGIVPESGYDSLLDELTRKLEGLPGPTGTPLGTRVLKPREIYATVKGIAPDLMAYFGGLSWRSIAGVGGAVFRETNDTGPDGANHDPMGIVILEDGSGAGECRIENADIYDVTPTLLELLGLEIPGELRGRSIARS